MYLFLAIVLLMLLFVMLESLSANNHRLRDEKEIEEDLE